MHVARDVCIYIYREIETELGQEETERDLHTHSNPPDFLGSRALGERPPCVEAWDETALDSCPKTPSQASDIVPEDFGLRLTPNPTSSNPAVRQNPKLVRGVTP